MIVASFNYSGPDDRVAWTAIGVGVVLVVGLFFSRRVWTGILGGGTYGTVGCWFVVGTGEGDMTELFQLMLSPVAGLIGMAAGGLSAGIGRVARGSRQTVEAVRDDDPQREKERREGDSNPRYP